MKRAELDWPETPTPVIGGAEVIAPEDDHNSHTFLYIPDLSSETGWSGHKVPEHRERQERRTVGFRER